MNEAREERKAKFLVELDKSLGIIARATRAIGADQNTVYKWAKADPEFAAAIEAVREKNKNAAKSALMEERTKMRAKGSEENKRQKEERKAAFLEAFEKSLGIITPAARAIGVERAAVYNWKKDDPEFAAAMKMAEEKQKDFAETKLMELINTGNVAAVIFYAKTKLRDRGYSEHIKVETQTEPLKIEFADENSPLAVALGGSADEGIEETD